MKKVIKWVNSTVKCLLHNIIWLEGSLDKMSYNMQVLIIFSLKSKRY